jgi:hypothetical protein
MAWRLRQAEKTGRQSGDGGGSGGGVRRRCGVWASALTQHEHRRVCENLSRCQNERLIQTL